MKFSTRVKMTALQNHPCAFQPLISVHTASSAQPEQSNQLPELNTSSHAVYALPICPSSQYKPPTIHSPPVLPGGEAWKIRASICVTNNGQVFWNESICLTSPDLARFRIRSEILHKTELTRGEEYGDGKLSKLTDVFSDSYMAMLRQHQFEPRVLFHWDSVSDRENACRLRILEKLASSWHSCLRAKHPKSSREPLCSSPVAYTYTYTHTQANASKATDRL